MSLAGFLDRALPENTHDSWNPVELAPLAGLLPPDAIFGRRGTLVRADINHLWADWFVQGICDPRRYLAQKTAYPHIFADALGTVCSMFPTLTAPECQEVAKVIANKVLASVKSLLIEKERVSIDYASRRLLLDLSVHRPSCWVCGFPFHQAALDAFLEPGTSVVLPLPDFVDVLKPIGLRKRDLGIEVDHVHPFSRGGSNSIDNLRLACGWCNRYKGASVSLYEAEGRVRLSGSRSIEFPSLPQPFWVVRTLATHRKCEHSGGCDSTANTSELTVALSRLKGAPTPSNLSVTCRKHDPHAQSRLIPRQAAAGMWGITLASVK